MIKRNRIRSFLFRSRNIQKLLSGLYMVEKPEGNVILVIAPHPDDDIIGCGGTIKLHRMSGHSVYIVYLTEGEKGIEGKDKNETSEIRKAEAIRAASKLDVSNTNLFYLHLEDGNVIKNSGMSTEFKKILETIRPEMIYVPSFFETHPDHYAANILLQHNLTFGVTIAGYEVWTPLIPNLLVNISTVAEEKRNALQEHASQLNQLPYDDASLSLNRYRAAMFGKDAQYAEAFIYCNSVTYFNLMKQH